MDRWTAAQITGQSGGRPAARKSASAAGPMTSHMMRAGGGPRTDMVASLSHSADQAVGVI
jgi:hypothetical protein